METFPVKAVIFLALAALSPFDARADDANCVNEVCFPSEAVLDDIRLPLRGVAEFRYWGFKVYVAAIYAPADVLDLSERLGEFPKQLRITYHRPFARDEFIKSGESLLSDNPEVDLASIRPSLELMNTLYRDVEPRDTYSVSYIPDHPLRLELNGQELGAVPGKQFAAAYFSMWLSRYSIGESFTERLIGREL